ncbi:MAG: Uma2 family endonuclease [Phaeodactylibacter sp.]|nr:Uma2 family endonuclease [Phaeodactylibacter sp.]
MSWNSRAAVQIKSHRYGSIGQEDHLRRVCENGITEYWVVDPSYHSNEIYTLQEGTYQLHAFGISGEQVASTVIKEPSIEVDSIFLRKPETGS